MRDFCLLNSHIAWNMSCERVVVCGVQMREPLKKFQFSDILAEELIKFTDVVDSYKMTELYCEIPSTLEQ